MVSKEAKTMVKLPRRQWSKMDKGMAALYFFLHVLCILAPLHFNWGAFWIAFVLYIITGLFGVTISYHRNLSHRSFKLPKWLEYLFAYCGVHTLQGDPISWVSVHRYHHQFVDTDKDPHSPIHGFLFSHITWIFDSDSYTQKVCSKIVCDSNEEIIVREESRNNVGDLKEQVFYRFLHKTYLLHPIALAVLLYAVGGIPYVIWGMFVRTVMLYHVTFMVNSVSHIWGKQQWKNGGLSRNNWWLSLLLFGEGWHNNHHAFEYSAKFGLEWWQIDFGWYVIIFLEAIGLAHNVKVPSQSHKQRLAMNTQS
ncbi:palmitoyl-monogalactosyldiacylglycerol delta-7 desaturase, chloroplastic-like [Benincasa hispida]|uniref:palmitoyl-monogalactosyldiacylglycerol delta-7 desaturase, chloroplastic-like n=1 Tax=Benincasa hispida TaxID=102211 RepID=UPI0019000AE2|nr:palmitoyl-monogalactosyldiacylglycerol delta-7 desaturase, chloroplastic-like [Benincasa hispida]XP_038880774.1 palmitoyl-monogalactosyldiacylglycerol delta-7 desaturase, chloroplastic-like [Benincasa hispida]XP_038880775.1 palmitoyl-monogalactosyldiacylglycerol delta-7 desaturase, chloroplastic-like [Benincasa hispida]XP_038880776.1 palmitoyl-monogalactosyldiacylglycerol delta-7 desaturase, chloroplastic-like [Benincasa hispida]